MSGMTLPCLSRESRVRAGGEGEVSEGAPVPATVLKTGRGAVIALIVSHSVHSL